MNEVEVMIFVFFVVVFFVVAVVVVVVLGWETSVVPRPVAEKGVLLV